MGYNEFVGGNKTMSKTRQFKRSFTIDKKRYYFYGRTVEEAEEKRDMARAKAFRKKQEDWERQVQIDERRMALEKIEFERQKNQQSAEHMTVAQWYAKYLEVYKIGIKKITFKNYDYKMKKRVISKLGEMCITDVKPMDCQEIISGMEGMSSDYIKKVYLGMRDLFEKARINKLISENPTDDLIVLKGTRTQRRTITEAERKIVLETIKKDPRFVFYAVMLFCGLRPSEVAGLQGFDVLDDGLLHVRGTKSINANRLVPIPKPLVAMLPKVEPDEFLFTNYAGKPLDEYGRRNLWHAFRHQLNITAGGKIVRNQLVPPLPLPDDLVPYCLRHTYCTDLQKAGVDIRTAQYLMGHSSITLTANVYTHIGSMQLETARELIDDNCKLILEKTLGQNSL